MKFPCKRDCITMDILVLWLLEPSASLLSIVLWALSVEFCCRYISLLCTPYIQVVFYFYQLWLAVVFSTFCQKKLLWRRMKAKFICEYKNKYFKCSMNFCWFRNGSVVDSSLGSMTFLTISYQLGSLILF